MVNPNAAPDLDPFAQLDSSAPLGATAKQAASSDPFADLDSSQPLTTPESTSATGAFAREAVRGTAPALGSIPAMGAGAEFGGAIGGVLGGPLAEFTAPAGALIGGAAGAIGGAALVGKMQDYALKMVPDSWRDALGLSDRQQKLDEGEHPVASFLGGVAPYALTMRPGTTPKIKLPENATALQRIMANPTTARLFGGAAMGGMQLGQEAVSDEGEGINWNRVAIATGFGLVFNRPTGFGERITEMGARPARALLGRPSPAASLTLNQAADAKVAGPGITEDVFQGTHAQDPNAEMTAQQGVRNEQAVLGTQEPPSPDIHATARRLDPELFAHYDELTRQRDVFQGWLAELAEEPDHPGAPVAQNHLAAINVEIRSLEPEVQAAYRRSAEATGTATTERPGAPDRFPSLAAMLAAQGEEGASAASPAAAEVQGAQPAGETGVAPTVPPRSIQEQRDFIAQDVARQLTAAGRPPEEAQAAGQLIAARYTARAARFGGRLGTAEELYRREGAEIRTGRTGGPTPATPAVPAPPLAPADQARAQNIDATKDVVSGANSSKDPNGPVYVDRRIPQESPTLKDDQGNPVNLWNSLQLHERVEADEMAKGKSYDEAHKDATAAERELARRTGYDFDAYTKEMDGYLSSIEHEKAENPPTDTHIDPEAAIGHHKSQNKQPRPAERLFAPPDPLDLAMSGKLTADVARDMSEKVKANQQEIEDGIFGSKERGDQWRRLHRQSDSAWNRAEDAKAKAIDQKISEFEDASNLSESDQSYLNGEGWPAHTDPDTWKELARNLQDIENGREDAVDVAASAVRYIPKTSDWTKMASREQDAVITVLTAMNQEVKEGRAPEQFLKDVFKRRIERYGGGHDAVEVTQAQMEDLAAFLKTGITREGAAPPAPDLAALPQPQARATNKQRSTMMVSLPAAAVFERSGMIENAEAYQAAAKKRREQNGGSSVRVFTNAAAEARAHGSTVKEANAARAALETEHGARFDGAMKASDIDAADIPKDVRQSAIQAMVELGLEPDEALDYAMLKAEREAQWIENEDARMAAQGIIHSEEGHGADVGEIPFDTGQHVAGEGQGDEGRGEEENAAIGGASRQARSPQEVEFFQRRNRDLIAEREDEGQQQIPGADRITQAELVQRRANAPLKPGVEQKPADEGLFGDQTKQGELFQRGAQLGSIVLNPTKAPGRDYIGVPDVRPIMRIAASGDPSTFIHESGHQYLGELMRDAEHPQAPDDLKADAKTVLDWLKVDDASGIKTKQHETFARGFEQYLREGVAPSPELAGVFGKFRDWLLRIYQTLRGLGSEITPEIRGVFDRLLASEPQRTVIAPERAQSPTLGDIWDTDAATTEPHEAEPAGDRILKEAEQYTSSIPRSISDEHATSQEEAAAKAASEPGGQAGAGAVAEGQVQPGSGGPEPVAPGGTGGAATGAGLHGGGDAVPEGAGQPAGGERSGSPSPTDAGLGDKPLAPRPRPQFGAQESPFLDKAGNIRVENLTTKEDVAQAIRDAANENNDFIGDRRGVVTDGQIEGLAEDIGMAGAEDLVKQRVVGQAFNAEQVMALRKLLVQSATDVSAAMKKAATGTDEDVIAYAMAKDRHQMIQATVAQATAEAGRALRAFRNIAGMSQEAQQADMFIREATGKTLFQLRREARLGAELKTPQQISQFMLDSQNKNFGRMVLEYWINGLISGPVTHMTYGIGNEILTLQKAVPETIAAAAIGNMRRALGREGDTVRMGEVGQKLRAHGAAFAPAAKAFFDALRTGQTVQLPGERVAQNVLQFPGAGIVEPALYDEAAKFSDVMASAFSVMRGIRDGMIAGGDIASAGGHERPFLGLRPSLQGAIPDVEIGNFNLPVGNLVRLPSRFVAAIHSFFRGVNFSMEKAGDSFRTATNEGLTGTAFDQRVAEMRARPSQAKMEQYALASSETTLMGQGGAFTKAISNLFNTPFFASKDASGKAIPGTGFPFLKFIDPFVHISSNIIQQSLVERTPLGVLSPGIRADLMGRNGNIAQDTAMARMLVGTAYAIGLGGLAAEGYVSGSEPADPRQAATWRMAGNQAHSVKVGDIWYDVHRLGPLGMLLGISADLYDVSHLAEQGDMLNAASHLQHAITQNILDESFMRGPSDLIRAVEDPGRYGESYIKNFLSGFVPYSVGMAQIARATDPYSRQARTVMDSIRAKVPGLSESLLPRRDIWGNEIPNKDAFINAGVTAIYEQRVSRDPVNLALLDLGIYPAQLERKVRNVQLTDQQYDDFQRIAGRMTKQRLDAIVNAPDYRTWPSNVRHDVIAEVITQSREAARGMMMMKYPGIVRDAAQAKLDRVNGKPR
jgi:hypothetical protein